VTRASSLAACAALFAVSLAACSTVGDVLPERFFRSPAKAGGRIARVAILPFAYRDDAATHPCDLCPDKLVMDVTSAGDAQLVTAFFYEALTRHPRIQVIPYDRVQASEGGTMRETLERLADSEDVDAVVVGALLELRQRIGDPREPRQRGGAAMYAALLDLPSGRPIWKRVFDHSPGRPGRAMRQYQSLVLGEEAKAMTAHEVAQLGASRMAQSLAGVVR
jgi:hypothetical protein